MPSSFLEKRSKKLSARLSNLIAHPKNIISEYIKIGVSNSKLLRNFAPLRSRALPSGQITGKKRVPKRRMQLGNARIIGHQNRTVKGPHVFFHGRGIRQNPFSILFVHAHDAGKLGSVCPDLLLFEVWADADDHKYYSKEVYF